MQTKGGRIVLASVAGVATLFVIAMSVQIIRVNLIAEARAAKRASDSTYLEWCRLRSSAQDAAERRAEGITPETFHYCMKWDVIDVDPVPQVVLDSFRAAQQQKRTPR
jgi:hypothetical protein